jgi:hypothetical protein
MQKLVIQAVLCVAFWAGALSAIGTWLPEPCPGLLTPTRADAADFRVESTVFANKQKEPVSQSTTLFQAGVVYDCLTEPPRIAILAPAKGRFILLDVAKQTKAELKLEEVDTAVESLRMLASKSPNNFLKFVADPSFSAKQNEDANEWTFTSPVMTYRVKGSKAESTEMAQQYFAFSQGMAKLNALLTPAAPPPFARMAVNAELEQRQWLPDTVELTIPQQLALGGRGLTMHSQHIFTARLLQADQDRIAEIGSQMANFKTVPFSYFRAE